MSCCQNKACTGCEGDGVFDCPDTTITGSNLLALNDNCEEKRLVNYKGVAASDGVQVGITGGSNEELPIYINPPVTTASKGVLVLADDDRLHQIQTAQEADVLMYSAGRWRPKSIGFAKTSFSESELQTFLKGRVPVLACSADNLLKLGVLPPCEESFVYFGADGLASCLHADDMVQLVVDRLCNITPDYNGTDCIDSIIVCTPNGLAKIRPIGGKVLAGDVTGTTPCWVFQDVTPEEATSTLSKLVFRYTGSFQTFTVPAGKTKMTIKAWGSGGSLDFGTQSQASSSPRSGVGGFTYGDFPVAPGGEYTVVVGGCNFLNTTGFSAYGFGGSQSADRHNHSGGGLSGVFSGYGEVTANDDARAILIAGGGGAAGRSNPAGASAIQGGPGNNPNGGQRPNFQGSNATNGQTNGSGGGGGGYRGGGSRALGGYGGSGYVHPQVTNSQILYAADNTSTVPGSGDPDYLSGVAGMREAGMVVVIFS